MKILMVTAEAAPYAKVGGLSQVIYFLSKSLLRQGHDVRIFMPKYGVIPTKKLRLKPILTNLNVPMGKLVQRPAICNLKTNRKTKGEPTTYFLENREYYELRANVFAYKDDHIRFFLLSRGTLEWLLLERNKKDGWLPDIIHCHDWHTGYLIEELRDNPRYAPLGKIPVLYTIHNFRYQGNADFKHQEEKKDKGKRRLNTNGSEKLRWQNSLLRGMIYADWVNTVSKTYAKEVLEPPYGEGLEEILNKIKGKFSGILNGLDQKEFNPKTDPFIEYNYDLSSLRKKVLNKVILQKIFHLPEKKVLVAGFVGRLSRQKGLELLVPTVRKFLEEFEAQFVFLGDGQGEYKNQLMDLKREFPSQIGIHLRTDFKLPRKIFAGADLLLIPSLFEPGGIVALEAMRYGTIPLAHKTGGLADSIEDFQMDKQNGNGFLFKQFSPWSLFATLVRAETLYQNKKIWGKLMKKAMKSDFSWDKVAREYSNLYRKVKKQRMKTVQANPHLAYKSTEQ